MNRFIYLFIFNFLLLSVREVKSDKGKGNCVLKDQENRTLYDYDWRYDIELNPVNDFQDPNIMIAQLCYENIMSVTKPDHNDLFSYFFAYTDFTVNSLVMKTNFEFEKYEEKETLTYHRFTVEFLCQNDERSEITFKIPIKDTNNHSPEFLNEPYEFTLPMPIPKGYHLDLTGKIAVRDIDITNKHITFNLDQNSKHADAFMVASSGPDAEKVKIHPAKFVASTALDLEEDVTYTLYATDSGNPSRTTNTSIKMIVDKANSFPRFTRSLYTSNLTEMTDFTKQETDTSILLSFSEGNIILDRGYQDLEQIEIKDVFNANKNDFILTKRQSTDNLATHIELINLTKEFLQQKVVTLTLSATKGTAETTTVVQILLPGSLKDKSTDDKVACTQHTNAQIIIEEVLNTRYIAATIMLSLVSIGLTGYVVYFLFFRQVKK